MQSPGLVMPAVPCSMWRQNMFTFHWQDWTQSDRDKAGCWCLYSGDTSHISQLYRGFSPGCSVPHLHTDYRPRHRQPTQRKIFTRGNISFYSGYDGGEAYYRCWLVPLVLHSPLPLHPHNTLGLSWNSTGRPYIIFSREFHLGGGGGAVKGRPNWK